ANEAFARFAGRAAGDLIGAGIELIDPDWPHGPAAESFERLRTVKSIGHAARLRRPDGGAFPVQLHVNHVCFGEFETLFGVALDTSARQAAEDALRASEMRYRAVTEDQTEFIVRLRRDLVVTFCNPAYVRLVSARNAESILGLRAGDVGHPEGAGWMERCIAGLTPENPVANNVTSAPTPDGEDVWISWNVRAIYSDDPTADEPVDREPRDDDSRADQPPHVREYQAVGRDVTESRRMLAALTRAQKRYRSLVEDSPDLVSRWDAGGSLTFANRTYRQYFGLPVDPAGDPDDMNRYDAVTRERIERSLAKLSPEEPVARLVTAGRRHDGMLRQLEWVERGFFDERDRLTEMQSVGRDVTDQVAAEALLAESERRQRAVLDDLAEMVNRFRPGDGTITYANRAFLEAKKTDDEPIVGRMTIFDHLDGNERASVRARLAAVTPECPSVSALLELPGPDGNNRWEEWSNRAIFDPPDPAKPDAPRRISEFQSVGRDVTDELVARDRRKEQREAA
ncbi:MAG: PAS domain-containing protein, partial [Planctomycetota bacterium]